MHATTCRCNTQKLCFLLLCLLLSLASAGCAGKSKQQELLAQDYQQMSDEDVLLYYYQLSDEIETSERSSSGSSVSFGFGTGGYRSHSGVGISSGVGSRYVSHELRERRNQVRLELDRRNLKPK